VANLLQICTLVAKDCGVLPPLSIIGNPDVTASGLLAQATRACRMLQADINWPILMREHTFTASNGVGEYDLPSDFDRFTDDTAWDRTAYWNMRGPLSPQEWQVSKSGLVQAAGLQKRWRIIRTAAAGAIVNKFVLSPTPTDANALVFEYISNAWATSANGLVLRTDWEADTDIPLIDEDLIGLDMTWRMLKRLGKDYQREMKEADDSKNQVKARQGGMPILGLTRPTFRMWPVNVPLTGIGS